MHGNASSPRRPETADHRSQAGQMNCEIAKELSRKRRIKQRGKIKKQRISMFFTLLSWLGSA